MITNTTGCLRNQDNRSILKITLTPNQPSLGCKAKLKKLLNKATKRSSSRSVRRTGQCSASKLSTVLLQGKSQPLNESPIRMDMGEILKQLDGPTASFQSPCSNKWTSKTARVMAHMAEVHLNARCPKATVELRQAMLLVPQVEGTSQFRSPRLPQ